jgi:putative ABC transport system ATP-binding protein
MLTVQHIAFAYKQQPVLSDVSFHVGRNDFVVFRGESGCGKSTLLRLLAKLEVPQQGEILLHDTPYAQIPSTVLRRRIAYLHQRPVIVAGSIRENLLLGFRFQSVEEHPPDEVLMQLLLRARLEALSLDAPAAELSIGQQQRLALLRLLLIKPEALLLDEPTASLDPLSTRVILEWLASLHRENGTTIILVMHGDIGAVSYPVRTFDVLNSTIIERGNARSA